MSQPRTVTVSWMDSIDAVVADGIRPPELGEDCEAYLERLDLLGHGFEFSELVGRSRRHQPPPLRYWSHLALTLRVAIEFRRRAIEDAGVKGLRVVAAYRPRGGASRSAHKFGKALDLDRIGGDGRAYYRCAARLWAELGPACRMGLGLYTWSTSALGGVRVHLDTDHGLRTWQHVSFRGARRPWGGRPLACKLVADMGLPDPLGRRNA